MADKKKIGVITEQGYVAGEGLGFNPVNETDLNPKNNDVQGNPENSETTSKEDN